MASRYSQFSPLAFWRLCRKLKKVENGLRFFQQASLASGEKVCIPHNKAMVRVRCPPDAVFKLIMDVSPARGDWDVTFAEG
jgi:hypothetical protein